MPQNKIKNKRINSHFRISNRRTLPKRIARQKIKELEKVSDVIDNLDAHYGFYLLKNCFSMPKLLYFLRTSPCFLAKNFFGTLRQITKKNFMQGH